MPELPEAETIVRTLHPHIVGRRIVEVRVVSSRACPEGMPPLSGQRVDRVRRYGKQVVIALDAGFVVVELRMTGLLIWREPAVVHSRACFRFAEGTLWFDDVRQFGSLRWWESAPDELGPDPLEISESEFRRRLLGRRRMVKPLLMDQWFLRGLGNIYADEILHRAGINPRARADGLARRAPRLYTAMRETLLEAIDAGGSTIRDFRDANGSPGRFQLQHQVYGKTGLACPACGQPVQRILVGQRGTHFCPRCQRT